MNMLTRTFSLSLLSVLFILSAAFTNGDENVNVSTLDWWESATLYQIYPRSFQDSNEDSFGDLKGITQRLAYLKEIGITATWLSPIFESPMVDFGYDISNFTNIANIFGNLDDFDEMIKKAHSLDIKVILDFVPNHSSDECEWFQKSVRREDGYDDFYVWHDGVIDPNNSSNRLVPSNWISVFGGSQWTWNAVRQQYFLHQFMDKQPDLNFSNPMVRQHMLGVLEFWLDRGVDGFRIDAVPHIFEKRYANGTYPDEPESGWSSDSNSYDYHDHIHTKDQYETVELVYEWRAFLDKYRKQHGGETRVLLAEAYSPIEVLSQYFGNSTHSGVHLPMNFNLMYLNGYSTARDIENSINYWMDTMWKIHQTANWVIGNHDNSRVADRMGRHKVDLMNIIVNALPGAGVTYYGEEIGMKNVPGKCNVTCDDRDPERSPMQRNTNTNAGFSDAPPIWWEMADDYKLYNVYKERGIARSHLQIYRGIQQLKHTPAFRAFKQPNGFHYGAVSEQVFQIIRRAPQFEEYRILVNMGNKVETVMALSDKKMTSVLLSQHSPRNIGDTIDLNGRLDLMPFEAVVLHC